MDAIKPMLDQLNIVVSDVAKAVEFFRLLGVDVADTAPEWLAHHRTVTSVSAGGITADLDSAAFAKQWNAGLPDGWTGVVIGLAVDNRDDVDTLYARATAAGHPGQQPPYDAFWGSRYAVVCGPQEIVVGIMSPADEGMRSAPPDPNS